MKVNNVIVYVLTVLVSAFLLWLWYYLGLSKVDNPLDLVLSIIWWAMVAVAIIAIAMLEKRRKERIRTVYVYDRSVFNSEDGMRFFEQPAQLVDLIGDMLDNLKYNFKQKAFPNKNEFPARYLVRTKKLNDNTWEGEVVTVRTKRETKFDSREELFAILTSPYN